MEKIYQSKGLGIALLMHWADLECKWFLSGNVVIEYVFSLDKIKIKFKTSSKQLKSAHTPIRGALNRNMRSDLDSGFFEIETSATASLKCNGVSLDIEHLC